MFADNERYEELARQMEEQEKKYHLKISELHLDQKKKIKDNRLQY